MHRISRLFGISSLGVLFIALSLPGSAQVNGTNSPFHGVPPSVTSFGFGGNRGFHGVSPSVTSLGFGSNSFRLNSRPFGLHHGHRNFGFSTPFFGNVVAVPYAYPIYVMEPGVDDSMEEDYAAGPTIFDRRGPSIREYARPQELRPEQEDYRTEVRPKPSAVPSAEPQQAVPEQPKTVLVFKNGREKEIANYAIVGAMLYELSDGRSQKVALAELDLAATVKQNDDRGVDFRLPAGTQLN